MTDPINKKLEAFRIVMLCLLAAITYGILHDLVTAHVCVEYFTIGHAPIFDTDDPVLLALGWGVVATWWVGLGLGFPVAFAALRGPRPVRTARSLLRPMAKLLLLMGICAAVALGLGYMFASADRVYLYGRLAERVPREKHTAFIANMWAHLASYLAGFAGSAVLVFKTWVSRSQPAAPTE